MIDATGRGTRRTPARERLRPDLRDAVSPYEPVLPAEAWALRAGLDPDRVVKLDANENPYGPSERALRVLRRAGPQYAGYPDPAQTGLREALARHLGVGADQVVAGAGAGELIDLLIRLLVAPGDAVVTCPPTFGMYGAGTLLQGGRLVEVPRTPDFAVDVPAVRDAIAAGGAKIAFLDSPSNPAGTLLDAAGLDALLETGALIVVDEVYVEFSGTPGFARRVERHGSNLAVLRSFSKWAGLAGLRVGYGVFSADLAALLLALKPPYTPGVPATLAALASLHDVPQLTERVGRIVRERERLRERLAEIPGVAPVPSRANFLLAHIDGRDARAVRDALRRRGVFVRHFASPPVADCLRITVGTPEQNDALVAALAEIMGNTPPRTGAPPVTSPQPVGEGRADLRPDVAAHFGRQAERYAASPMHAAGEDLDLMLEMAAPRPGETALDVGTGAGFTALALARAGTAVLGVDLSAGMIRQARRLAASRERDVPFALADAAALPLAPGSVDVVTCRLAAQHMPDLPGALAEFRRVLRPGGRLVVSDTLAPEDEVAAACQDALERGRDATHVGDYSCSRWRRFLHDAGFELVRVATLPSPQDFETWVTRAGTPANLHPVLRLALAGAPEQARREFDIRADGGTIRWQWTRGVLLARRA